MSHYITCPGCGGECLDSYSLLCDCGQGHGGECVCRMCRDVFDAPKVGVVSKPSEWAKGIVSNWFVKTRGGMSCSLSREALEMLFVSSIRDAEARGFERGLEAACEIVGKWWKASPHWGLIQAEIQALTPPSATPAPRLYPAADDGGRYPKTQDDVSRAVDSAARDVKPIIDAERTARAETDDARDFRVGAPHRPDCPEDMCGDTDYCECAATQKIGPGARNPPLTPPDCSGPFASAHDCPVHRPQTSPAKAAGECVTCKGRGRVVDHSPRKREDVLRYGEARYIDCPICGGSGALAHGTTPCGECAS